MNVKATKNKLYWMWWMSIVNNKWGSAIINYVGMEIKWEKQENMRVCVHMCGPWPEAVQWSTHWPSFDIYLIDLIYYWFIGFTQFWFVKILKSNIHLIWLPTIVVVVVEVAVATAFHMHQHQSMNCTVPQFFALLQYSLP